tara:strand:- start:3399 stop:3947 length:549 start_codon:yes stop_codon:yes gene_type:complete
MDSLSFVIGILIGAVGLFATGFLRKAGEDLYSMIKSKVKPENLESSMPQVVINLHGNETPDTSELLPATVDHTSRVNFLKMADAIDNAPPLQREEVASNYVGINVEWITYLQSAHKQDDGNVSLRLSIDENYQGRGVWCLVDSKEYKELSVLPRGVKIRVSGEISEACSTDVRLTNVHLQIL